MPKLTLTFTFHKESIDVFGHCYACKDDSFLKWRMFSDILEVDYRFCQECADEMEFLKGLK